MQTAVGGALMEAIIVAMIFYQCIVKDRGIAPYRGGYQG
jgi:hypothetical protein